MRYVKAAVQGTAGFICGSFVAKITQVCGFSWIETMIFIFAIAVLMFDNTKSE